MLRGRSSLLHVSKRFSFEPKDGTYLLFNNYLQISGVVPPLRIKHTLTIQPNLRSYTPA
jgi:hypothetical protein